MPYRRKYRKKRRRRRRRYKSSPYTSRQLTSGISKRQIVKMRYFDRQELDATAGNIATFVVSASSPFQPNITISGHQPLGFDQWMAFYNHFVVLGARIRCDFFSQDTDGLVGTTMCAIQLRGDTTSVAGDPDRILEYNNVVSKPLTAANAQGTTRIYHNYSAKKFLGRTSVLSDPALKGTAAANPEENAYFHITAAAPNDADNPGAVNICYQIDYIVALIEPKLLPTSS